MTGFVIKMLDLLKAWIEKLPDLSVDDSILGRMVSAMDTIIEFISVANFLIPLDHVMIILGLIYTIRNRKFIIAIINWVIRRIADFFP